MDAAAFLVFIEQVLGPRLRKGDHVVLGNLNTHGSPKVGAALCRRSAFLLFLPRYSPDMKPIAKAWSKSPKPTCAVWLRAPRMPCAPPWPRDC